MVEQLMLLRLNKPLIPDIVSLRDAEAEINTRALVREKAVKDNAQTVAAAANAPGAAGVSGSSTAPTGIAASSGRQSLKVMDLISRLSCQDWTRQDI